ncbi:MAG: glycosyltransferase family 2 protein [Thermodesulfobacteriota bacterium]
MAQIFDITPRTRDIQPVLMLVTSHRMDCFLLCLKCLELCTDLSRFHKIYVLANDVSGEHAVMIKAFQHRNRNVVDIHLTPRGVSPAVMAMQNFIMARHPEAVFVKLEEDVFVTPGWLEQLLATYKLHLNSPRVAAVVPVMPVTRTGRQVTARLLRKHYPRERLRLPDLPVEKNALYHRLVWEKVLGDDLAGKYAELEKPRHYYLSHASNNLALWGPRLTGLMAPMGLKPVPGASRPDELQLNSVLRMHNLRAAVVTSALVHHFSHAECEDYLRRHVSLDDVWWYMTGLAETAPPAWSGLTPGGQRKSRLIRMARERNLRVLR